VPKLSSYNGLSVYEGDDSLGLRVSTELERRWSDGSSTINSICHYSLVPTGKLFRPILLLESALAVGGDAERVLPAAVGAECGHVASLIHDDIIDGDDLRRGRASVQHKYGINDAIVAGDALIFDLFAALAECRKRGVDDGQVVAAFEAVAHAGLDLCRGQSLEAELTADPRFDIDAYLTVARLKTASFFKGSCVSGAILGGGSQAQIDTLGVYGESLGIAFQIHDDLLAYTSDTGTTGKRGTSDVENGRLTLPVILAHEAGSHEERQIIKDLLFSRSDSSQRLSVLTRLVDRTGAVATAARMARDFARAAADALKKLPDTPSRDRLSCFTDAVINRDY
jgi:geranylgeranyl pyrophosphate synthase